MSSPNRAFVIVNQTFNFGTSPPYPLEVQLRYLIKDSSGAFVMPVASSGGYEAGINLSLDYNTANVPSAIRDAVQSAENDLSLHVEIVT